MKHLLEYLEPSYYFSGFLIWVWKDFVRFFARPGDVRAVRCVKEAQVTQVWSFQDVRYATYQMCARPRSRTSVERPCPRGHSGSANRRVESRTELTLSQDHDYPPVYGCSANDAFSFKGVGHGPVILKKWARDPSECAQKILRWRANHRQDPQCAPRVRHVDPKIRECHYHPESFEFSESLKAERESPAQNESKNVSGFVRR
jgi:hypothetical protein